MSDADNEDAPAETNPSNDDIFATVQRSIGKLLSKENAQYLWNDITYVKALFGAFDGLIISYSTFKCYFDLACPPGVSASNAMHEWMSSPLAFLGVMAETAFIMTLSCIGTLYDDDDKNKMKATLAWLWPYFRDAFKGLKFAYRGTRSVIQMALLLGADLQSAFLPVGVVLGLLASANRVWYRNKITDPRKKYQKKNTILLGVVQNLDSNIDYELCPMVIGPIEQNKIAIAINETDNVLEYKVYSRFGDLQSGTIDLANELHYQKRFDDQHKPIAPTFESLIAEGYSGAIRFHIAQRGHLSKRNDLMERHAISADMGACCSTVMLAWPKDDGSNINLGPYDSGYIRVINEHGGHSGLVYAKRNKCCSLFLSELPPDPSKISLGDFDAAYVRIFNETKGFNRLYYLNKKTGEWNELQVEDKTLRQYDSKIYSAMVPRDLSTQELKEISSLTTFKKPELKHYTITYSWEQLSIDAEKLDQYDAMITETCRVRITSSQPSLAEKVKVHDLKEILIIYADGKYKVAYCNESGAYDEVLITDWEMLKLLSEYQSGSYVQTKDHQQINKFLASRRSHSRATIFAAQDPSIEISATTKALSIKQLKSITSLTKHKHHEKQHLPSTPMRMASAFFGGLIDGLYTYMAAIGLVALCPPLLAVMIGCCSLFTLLCVINRCFEEYEFQQEFIRSRLNDELALLQKEIQSVMSELVQLKLKSLSNCNDAPQRLDDLILHLEKHLIPKYKKMREEYVLGGVLSYRRALLSGLRSGLYFYSAFCSIQFAAAAFCAIAMTAFPPAWVIVGFALGIVAVIGFVLSALYAKSLHVEKTEEQARRCVTVMVSEPSKSEQDEVVRSGNILLINTEKGIKIGYCSKGETYRQVDVSDKVVIDIVTRFTKRLGAETKSGGTITKPADLEKITTLTKSLDIRAYNKTEDKERCVAVIVSEPSKSQQDDVIKSGNILFINTEKGIQIGFCLDSKTYKQEKVSHKEIIDIVKRFPKGGAITLSTDLAQIEVFTRLLGIRTLEKKEPAHEDLNTFLRTLKGNLMAEKAISIGEGVDALYRSMEFDSLVQMRAQEVCEWFRSFFSGLSKGQKVVDYLNPCQEADARGHYSDSPLMIILGFIVSLFYAVVYALRAFAKNWRGSNDVPVTPVRLDPLNDNTSLLHDVAQAESLVRLSEPQLSPALSSSSSSSSSSSPPVSPFIENLDDHPGKGFCSELIDPASILSLVSSGPHVHYSSPISGFRSRSGSDSTKAVISSSPRRNSVPRTLFGSWPDKNDLTSEVLLKHMREQHRSESSSTVDDSYSPAPL